MSYPELPIETKRTLGYLGIFGSDAQNAPSAAQPWREYRAQRAQDRTLGKLADNTDNAMAHVPEYQAAREDGTLGLTMALAWTAVRGVRSSGVYLASPTTNAHGETDGVATALVTSATFEDWHHATLWHTMVQGVYNRSPARHIVRPRSASPDWVPPTEPWDPAWIPPQQTFQEKTGVFVQTTASAEHEPQQPRPHTVEVTELSEYDRIINEATSVLIRNELAAIGIVLPREKVPLDEWLKTTTLHPEIETWLRAIDDTYRTMHERGFVVADYIDGPAGKNLKPGRREHIIATDPSAASKVKRDEVNGLIHEVRGGDSRRNSEQNPNHHERYHIEDGVHLRRPRPARNSKYFGPLPARPLNILERAWVATRETWQQVKNDPKRRLPELLPEIVGKTASKAFGGMVDISISAGVLLAKAAVAGGKGGRDLIQDIVGFRRQKASARSQLSGIYLQLSWMQYTIDKQGAPDHFPESALPPSKQLEVIKQMTDMMLQRLGQADPNLADSQ